MLTPSLLFLQGSACVPFLSTEIVTAHVSRCSSTEIVHELDADGTGAIEWQEFVRHMVDIGHDGR